MIRLAMLIAMFAAPVTAQDWEFAIDIDNGTLKADKSGDRQTEFSSVGPYMSAEAFAVVDSGPVPPCNTIDRFEVDLFFGWTAESNGHLLTQLVLDGSDQWQVAEPWFFLTMDDQSDPLLADRAELVLNDVACADDNTLRVAMALTARVTGDDQDIPVTVTAKANAPIQHIDFY